MNIDKKDAVTEAREHLIRGVALPGAVGLGVAALFGYPLLAGAALGSGLGWFLSRKKPQGTWDATMTQYIDGKKRIWVKDLTAPSNVVRFVTADASGNVMAAEGPTGTSADDFARLMDEF